MKNPIKSKEEIGRRLCATALLAMVAMPALAAPSQDAAAVSEALMGRFDRPEVRLQVAPVVVAGDHALAGWRQGERGGRALLHRVHGRWQIAVCGGDALKETALLRDAGVPEADAHALAREMERAEQQELSASQRRQLSSFEGLMRMDGSEHPQHQSH